MSILKTIGIGIFILFVLAVIIFAIIYFLWFFGIIEYPLPSITPPRPQTSTSVKQGPCIEYGTVDPILTIPEEELQGLDDNDWTVMFWIKINTPPPTTATIMKKGQLGSPSILYNKKYNIIQFTFTSLQKQYSTKDNFNKLELGEWKHFTWVQSGNDFKIYEDGILYITNEDLLITLSPGSLEFNNINQYAEIIGVTICQESLSDFEISAIYEQEKPKSSGNENMTNRIMRMNRIEQARHDAKKFHKMRLNISS